MLKKRIRLVLVILGIGLVCLGVYKLADSIVDSGYSSESRLLKENREENINQKKVNLDEEKTYEDDGSSSKYQKVKVLFNENSLESRRKDFLEGSNIDYTGVLKTIKDRYKVVFNDLSVGPETTYLDVDYTLSVATDLVYDWEGLKGFNSVYVPEESVTIIDMFDNKYVVYSYNYYEEGIKQLFVVDYSESKMNINSKELFEFGDSKSLLFYPRLCKYERYEDFDVVFFKEF